MDIKTNGEEMIKQPWKAVFLSLLLPGAGQIYGGNKSRGIIFIFVYISLYLSLSSGFLGFLFLEDAQTSRLFALIAIASGVGLFIFSIYVLFNAYKLAKNYNANHHLTIEKDIKKKPWLSVFLSYLVPGIGQFYNKQTLKAIAFIIIAVGFNYIAGIYYLFFIILMPFYLFVLKDAFDSAEKINGSNQKFLEKENIVIKIFVIVMILFNFFPFHDIFKIQIQAFKFPSGSMLPTLEIGDHILVNKTEKAKDSIKRGDIIVFRYPENPKKDFIKRVVGVGGDIIESRDKKIFINGSVIQEPYVQHTDSAIRAGKNEPRDNFGPFIIPQNKFFVMGDNREQSYDSRYWGYVPRTDIKGKAFKIYWSWDSRDANVRWDRIGKKIE